MRKKISFQYDRLCTKTHFETEVKATWKWPIRKQFSSTEKWHKNCDTAPQTVNTSRKLLTKEGLRPVSDSFHQRICHYKSKGCCSKNYTVSVKRKKINVDIYYGKTQGVLCIMPDQGKRNFSVERG